MKTFSDTQSTAGREAATRHERSVSRYPTPTLAEVPEDIRARIEDVEGRLGFVPNVFWALAHRPAEFRAFFSYFDALMLKESGVTKAEREMIVVVTTAINHSTYCVAHHSAILRLRSRSSTLADRLSTNYHRAEVTERQRAMLEFAVKVANESYALSDADFGKLAEHGFSEEDAWDIGAITAFFAHGSRMANLIDMRPNSEFDKIGRTI